MQSEFLFRSARSILLGVLCLWLLCFPAAAAPAGGYTVFVVPHSHIDVEWFWTYDPTRATAIPNLRQALVILRQDPHYAFLQDMLSVLEPFWDTLQAEDRQFLQRMIREGRLEVATGMPVQPEVNEPDFESLTRQFLLGKPWLEQVLGSDIRTCWNIDTFGQTVQMPQLAWQAGLKYLVFARDVPAPMQPRRRNLLTWKSPHGSRIPFFIVKENGYPGSLGSPRGRFFIFPAETRIHICE